MRQSGLVQTGAAWTRIGKVQLVSGLVQGGSRGQPREGSGDRSDTSPKVGDLVKSDSNSCVQRGLSGNRFFGRAISTHPKAVCELDEGALSTQMEMKKGSMFMNPRAIIKKIAAESRNASGKNFRLLHCVIMGA